MISNVGEKEYAVRVTKVPKSLCLETALRVAVVFAYFILIAATISAFVMKVGTVPFYASCAVAGVHLLAVIALAIPNCRRSPPDPSFVRTFESVPNSDDG